jgi:hypothetical protein
MGQEVEMMSRRVVLSVIAILLASCALVAASWLAPVTAGIARADDGLGTQTGGQKISVFEDLTIGPGESWDNVVVVGGDAVIEGTVRNGVVVVGGNLTVRAGASIGHSPSGHPDDAAIVTVFGKLTIEPGAVVSGRVVDIAGGASGALHAVFVDPIVQPWRWDSILGWILSTVFLALVALIIAAIAPRQVAFVRDRARRHFFSSLGWGVLGAVIFVPLVTIILIVTLIGIPVVVPWLGIVLPVMLLFGFVAIGAVVGRLILGKREDQRAQVMLAAIMGVVILSVIRWIPFAGAIIIFLAFLLGFGATYTAIWEWRRRAGDRGLAMAALPATAAGMASGPDAAPPTPGGSGGQEPPAG